MSKDMFLAINAAIFYGDNERPSFIEGGDLLVFTGAATAEHFQLLGQAGIEGANTTIIALLGSNEHVLACVEHPEHVATRFSTVLLKHVNSREDFNSQFPDLVKTRTATDKTPSPANGPVLQA